MSKFTLSMLISLLLCIFGGRLIGDDSAAHSEMHLQKLRLGTSSVQIELREASDSATFAVTGLSKLGLLQKLSSDELQKTINQFFEYKLNHRKIRVISI